MASRYGVCFIVPILVRQIPYNLIKCLPSNWPQWSQKRLGRASTVAKVKPVRQPYWTLQQDVNIVYKSMFDRNFVEPRNRRISLLYSHEFESIYPQH